MSGEVPRAKRIPFARLAPADVLFFGDAGLHSSDQGVALSRLSGWYRDRFAWARRPRAETGLEPSL